MQKELRVMDNRLTELNNELLNYKDSGICDSVYKRIYDIARTMPIIKHPIIQYGYSVKNNYFAILIMTATCEDSINDNQLLFLQRMALADAQRTSIDIYLAGIGSILPENVIFKLEDNIKEQLSYQLLLDMLIIANLSTVKTRKTFEIIAGIAHFLGIQRDTLAHISYLAALILKQNCENYLNENSILAVEEDDMLFGYYLREVPGWNEIVLKAGENRQRKELIRRFCRTIQNEKSVEWSNSQPIGVELSAKEEYGENWYYYE